MEIASKSKISEKKNKASVSNGLWIPKEIIEYDGLNWQAKLIFLKIHSFYENGRQCFISNEYFATYFHLSISSVSRYIRNLKKIGWVKEVSFDGTKRILVSTRVGKNAQTDYSKMNRLTKQDCSDSLRNFAHHNKQANKKNKKEFNLNKDGQINYGTILR